MVFKPNKRFRREYNRIYKKDPQAANLYLLMCELADQNGQVRINEEVLAELMAERFEDAREYAL